MSTLREFSFDLNGVRHNCGVYKGKITFEEVGTIDPATDTVSNWYTSSEVSSYLAANPDVTQAAKRIRLQYAR